MVRDERVLATILEIFQHNPQRKFRVNQLERMFSRDHTKFAELIKALISLEQEKQIVTDGNGEYQLVDVDTEITGIFRANEKGFGLVRIDDEENADDTFVGPDNTLPALDSDYVKVKIIVNGNPWNGKEPKGKVTETLERGVEALVGEFYLLTDIQVKLSGFYGYVTSSNKKFKNYKIYTPVDGITPQMGDMVKVSISQYPTEDMPENVQGAILETIGNKNDPGIGIMSIVIAHDIRTGWPEDAMKQANEIPDHIGQGKLANRVDIRDQPAVTVDGDDSKDFDDATVLWELSNGNYHLGVHIADVAHYVKENSPLDKEVYQRGNSTCLVDRVIPMLPFRPSNGICSISEGVDRLVLSCDVEITPEGKRVAYDIHPSIVRSHGRLTYNKVNEALTKSANELEEKYAKLQPTLKKMVSSHGALYSQRHDRGAIDFEEPEAKIIVDEKGKPVNIVLHNRETAEKMIESFMLLANETVAEAFFEKRVPLLYRVHETPDAERIQGFFEFVSALGLNIKADPNDVKPIDLQKVVTKTLGTPEEAIVQMVMLRSLKQAHYSDEPLGHFGITAEFYTHSTSPVRRYSDLMVHRMIHEYTDSNLPEDTQKHFGPILPDVTGQTSTQERKSIDIEREVNDLKMVEFMSDHVGEHFDVIISSVTSFGMFIQLPSTVKGLIHISNLTDDFYNFDEKTLTLTGRGAHRQFEIGMPLKVTLISADVEQHQLDFEIYDPNAPKKEHNDRGICRPRCRDDRLGRGSRNRDGNRGGRKSRNSRDNRGRRRYK